MTKELFIASNQNVGGLGSALVRNMGSRQNGANGLEPYKADFKNFVIRKGLMNKVEIYDKQEIFTN